MTDYSAVVGGTPTLEKPPNEALECTSSKLDKDSYLSRLRDWFIYLTGGVAFLTSVLSLSYYYVATKLMNDLQGRVTNCEQAVVSQVNNLAEQVDKLKVGADTLSGRLSRAEEKFGTLQEINSELSQIVNVLNNGESLGPYVNRFE